MAETLSFPGYAPDRFARLKTTLAARGLVIDGDAGTIQRFGCEVVYRYLCNGGLTLLVNKPPHFYSLGAFCRKLEEEINAQQ